MKRKLIEGRCPNVYVASPIVSVTNTKAEYIKNRAFDNKYYKELILEYIKEYGHAIRKEAKIYCNLQSSTPLKFTKRILYKQTISF